MANVHQILNAPALRSFKESFRLQRKEIEEHRQRSLLCSAAPRESDWLQVLAKASVDGLELGLLQAYEDSGSRLDSLDS